jgi:hypothetical protein
MRFVGRANAAQHVVVQQSDDNSIVVLYGRDGLVRGVLCVNATRKLIAFQQAIVNRTPWAEVVPG